MFVGQVLSRGAMPTSPSAPAPHYAAACAATTPLLSQWQSPATLNPSLPPSIRPHMNTELVKVAVPRHFFQMAAHMDPIAKPKALDERPVTVIAGGNGCTGMVLAAQALLRNQRVVILTSSPKEGIDNDFVKQVKVSRELYQKEGTSELAALLLEQLGRARNLSLINAIGGSCAPRGKTLCDVNKFPALTLQQAMEDVAIKNKDASLAMVQISSIAATILGNEHVYGLSRKETDETLRDRAVLVPVTSIRPGLVFSDMVEGKVDMKHNYSPEQLACFTLQPVIGRNALMQPVHIDDFAVAIFNALEQGHHGIVDAVGSEAINMGEMISLFRRLNGKKDRIIEIPQGFAEMIAKHFPNGRVAPYSVDMLGKLEREPQLLDTAPFEKLLGTRAKGFTETYMNGSNEQLVLAKPDLIGHIRQILVTVATDKEARAALQEALVTHGPEILGSIARVLTAEVR